MNDKKTYVCKRARMCDYLKTRGYIPYKIAPDKDNPNYSVFLFDGSPELYAAVTEYIVNSRQYMQKKQGENDNENPITISKPKND